MCAFNELERLIFIIKQDNRFEMIADLTITWANFRADLAICEYFGWKLSCD